MQTLQAVIERAREEKIQTFLAVTKRGGGRGGGAPNFPDGHRESEGEKSKLFLAVTERARGKRSPLSSTKRDALTRQGQTAWLMLSPFPPGKGGGGGARWPVAWQPRFPLEGC